MIKNPLPITACVLSLASNIEPTKHLEYAKNWLMRLGNGRLSDIDINDDTAENSASLVYHNQIAYVEFFKPIDYWDWLDQTKLTEQAQQRTDFAKPRVTLDIDIVAIKPAQIEPTKLLDEKNTQFLVLPKHWLGIARRFPLADYDKRGVEQLKLDFLQTRL